MRVDRARHRVVVVIVAAVMLLLCSAVPAGAADDPPQITELVPIRIHGTDTSWPPVLIYMGLVVVGGGIIVAVIFLRRAREALPPRPGAERAERANRSVR